MNYYIIYNYKYLKIKVIKLNGLDQKYIKDDNEYYIKITKARYNKTKRMLDSKMKKDYNKVIFLLDNIKFENTNKKKSHFKDTDELGNLFYSYSLFYNVFKKTPIKFFKSIDKKYKLLNFCKEKRDFYNKLYEDSLSEEIEEEYCEY